MNEVDIMTITGYIETHLFEPGVNWPWKEFELRSYSRWAAYEILQLVMDNPFISTKTLIEDFIIRMTYFSCVAEGTTEIFTIATNTAGDILNLLGGDV